MSSDPIDIADIYYKLDEIAQGVIPRRERIATAAMAARLSTLVSVEKASPASLSEETETRRRVAERAVADADALIAALDAVRA